MSDETVQAEDATLLDFVPLDEAVQVGKALQQATRKRRQRKYAYAGDPRYELRPAKKDPRVKRWMKRFLGGGKEQSSHLREPAMPLGEMLSSVEGLGHTFPQTETLVESVAANTPHDNALHYWHAVKISVADKPAADTPLYYPDTNEISIGKSQLNPDYLKRFGIDSTPDMVMAHELTHAWDFARGRADGHFGKSYWLSKHTPQLVRATRGRAPKWIDRLSEFRRLRYATVEASEMPAILTEYALAHPERYVAVTQWFKERAGYDLAGAMKDLWGFDLTEGVYVNEQVVKHYVEAMDEANRRGFWDALRGGPRWRSKVARVASYTGAKDTLPEGEFDPAFVRYDVVSRSRDFVPIKALPTGGSE